MYGARTRLSSLGFSLGPFGFGPDRWPWRDWFDARWASGLIRPARNSWARIEELAGLLKPPTVHARLPLLSGDIPTYEPGKSLLPQGWHRGPDGRERLIATRDDDTLFEVQVGKAGWGKTMRALVQAVASAHGRRGLAFVDPHRDSWATVAPYLAHPRIMSRAWLFDLTIRDPQDRMACWNPLSMTGSGQAAHEVVAAATVLTLAGAAACTTTANDRSAPADKQAPAGNAAPQQGATAAPARELDQTRSDDGPLAQVDGESDLTLRITAAQQSQGGKWLTIRGTITNNPSAHFYSTSSWRGDFRDMPKSPQSVSGATLVDEASMKRFYVLRDTTGLCLCTTGIGRIEAGEAISFTTQFPAPPASSTELGFQLPTNCSAR